MLSNFSNKLSEKNKKKKKILNDNNILDKNIINGNSNNINCNNTINDNKNLNITINSFGNENIDHIINNPDKLKEFISNVYSSNNPFIGSMEAINFHPDYKENHNICYKNIRSNDVDVYNDDKWEVRDFDEVSNCLFMHNKHHLEKLILNNNKINKNIRDEVLFELIKFDACRIDYDDMQDILRKNDYNGEINMKKKYVKNLKNDVKKLLYNKTNELNINKKINKIIK